MIKAVLIDDEPKALQSLKWEIDNCSTDVEVLTTFENPLEALAYLKKSEDVNCVFLDIEMPEMDGFQLLDQLPDRTFAVIITTAYDQYGIHAIKEKAQDYLLKPIDSDDLILALDRVREFLKGISIKDHFEETLMKLIVESNNSNRRIGINCDGKIIFLCPSEIIYCEGDGNYTSIFLENGQKLFITQTLKKMEEKLDGPEFFRVHNSYIINLTKVREYFKTDSYVVLTNEKQIPVARQRKSIFLNQF